MLQDNFDLYPYNQFPIAKLQKWCSQFTHMAVDFLIYYISSNFLDDFLWYAGMSSWYIRMPGYTYLHKFYLSIQAKKLEADIDMTRKEMEDPTEVEIELKRRLGQLTDHLIQKQAQVCLSNNFQVNCSKWDVQLCSSYGLPITSLS